MGEWEERNWRKYERGRTKNGSTPSRSTSWTLTASLLRTTYAGDAFDKIPAKSTKRLLDRALIDIENAPTVVGIRLEVKTYDLPSTPTIAPVAASPRLAQ